MKSMSNMKLKCQIWEMRGEERKSDRVVVEMLWVEGSEVMWVR